MNNQQWDHNNHYHNWILSQLPDHIEYAIDIGCGKGEFTKRLSSIARHVDAIDNDEIILEEAKRINSENTNINYLKGDFLKFELPSEKYDVVVSIASLHHMRLSIALEKMKYILKPGGTLVVLDLYRDSNLIDFFWSGISKIFGTIIKIIIHQRSHMHVGHEMKIVDPKETIREINTIAKDILPNMKMRRHLFWRYSIVWIKINGQNN